MVQDFKKKKSLLVIRNLVIAEVLAYGLFILLALSADWAEMYQGLFIQRYLSFTVLEFGSLGIIQIVMIVWMITKSVQEEQDIREVIRQGTRTTGIQNDL